MTDSVRANGALTEGFLISGLWTYSRLGGIVYSDELRLLRGGKVSGYSHKNEASWSLQDGHLCFLDAAGSVTTRFDQVIVESDAERLTLSGQVAGGRIIHCLARRIPEAPAERTDTTRFAFAKKIEAYGWSIGKHTYGVPEVFEAHMARLSIGSFCSIARGVSIALGDHNSGNVSTYPFQRLSRYWPEAIAQGNDHVTKGDVTIGSDVWIGTQAFIASGVTIGSGAVIGAHSVVVKDVPAYAIVVGNPARIVKFRFPTDIVERLLVINWWNWSDDDIRTHMPLILSDDVRSFIGAAEQFLGLNRSSANGIDGPQGLSAEEQRDAGAARAVGQGSHDMTEDPRLAASEGSSAVVEASMDSISVDQLVNTRWTFGTEGRPVASTTFFFAPNGRIEGYVHKNEASWKLEGGILHIFDIRANLTWTFTRIAKPGLITLHGTYHGSTVRQQKQVLRAFPEQRPTETQVAVIEPRGKGAPDDGIRLVIWDLDDTFWSGTLAEGGVEPIAANIAIMKALADRGIMSAVCSKNYFEPARDKLIELGVWDLIVFPKIAFLPKGAMLQEIVVASLLRPESIIFVDDNEINLNEARYYIPGLGIAPPSFLPLILDDPRFCGKPDPDHTRLRHYRVIEQKLLDKTSSKGDNTSFLSQSQIKVSFHHDVIENFSRIHDLVNRTNQLNFTKNRWPEDVAEAMRVYHDELESNFHSECGYIRVSDRYGDYGICGFYLINKRVARHFLFSCRAMDMGIEQFVWQTLHRPQVPVTGEIISDIAAPVDWIDLVSNAAQGVHAQGSLQTICVRGACDLEMMGYYLRSHGKLVPEFPFPFQGWSIFSTARAAVARLQNTAEQLDELSELLPGLPPGRFESALVDDTADVYILSFSQEASAALYRSRSTGVILPMALDGFGREDLPKISYEELVAKGKQAAATEAQWSFLRSDLEYMGGLDMERFKNDLRMLFRRLDGKKVIVLMLNSTIGSNTGLLNRFADINQTVLQAIRERNCFAQRPIELIEINDVLESDADLTDDRGGAHFVREIYRKLADRVVELLDTTPVGASPRQEAPSI